MARHIADTLVALGVSRVYGLPGEDHMALLDAFAAGGLEYRAAFNESAAVLMAATEAQLTGLPGVVVLSLAPGVSNGLNGLLNAYLDEVPLIVISGQHPAAQMPFVIRQGFDLDSLVAPMTVWRARVTADMNVPRLVGRAVDQAMSERRGPVYLEIPTAVAAAPSTAVEETTATVARLAARWRNPLRATPAADPYAVEILRKLLANARRPALVIGGRRGRLRRQTAEAFSTAFRTPVFVSSGRKGTLDTTAPYYAGTFLNGKLERHLLDDADLVVLVDPESYDFYNRPWCFDAPSVALVTDTFTEWGNPIDEVLPVDPDATLRALVDAGVDAKSEWTPEHVLGYRDHLRTTLLGPDEAAFSVSRAVAAALDAWPKDGWLVADAGFSKPLVAMLSEPSTPGHYLASNALSTMGYAIPAAAAARHAGAAPILTFLGDGSLLMRASELATAAGEGTPWVTVAIMDRSLTQIEVKQERARLAPVGVTLPQLSCTTLADTFGIDGVDVHSADELRAMVAKGMSATRPLLIGAHVDPAPSRELFEVLRG